MKKLTLVSIFIAAAALTACDSEQEQLPGGDDTVEVVDDCPDGESTTGEPCK